MKLNSRSYAEVLEVLNNFDKEELNKIPEEVIDYVSQNASDENIQLDNTKKLEEQISKESLTILTYIIIKYVADNNQKKQIKDSLIENQITYQ